MVENFIKVIKDTMSKENDTKMKDDVRFIAHKRIEELEEMLWKFNEEIGFGEEDFEGIRQSSRERAERTMMEIARIVEGRLMLRKKD